MSQNQTSIKYILTDIEGTTSSISFVTDELFPYFRAHCNRLLARLDDRTIQEQFDEVKRVAASEGRTLNSNEEIIQELIQWSLEDRKATPLKMLQGVIWNDGYASGELKGHVYEEVPLALEKWKTIDGLQLGIFSSGSIAAQKLLFGHTEYGNLNTYFSHNFDTTTGHKRETTTYTEIAKQLNLSPNDILFLSDIKEELVAADLAGYQTIQLLRNGAVGDWKNTSVNFTDIII